MNPTPRHIAIIMDGNGRWAQTRKMMRMRGHEQGTKTVHNIAEACSNRGVEQLTLYAFSEENWKRPRREIMFLMRLLRKFVAAERDAMMRNNIRLTAIGRLDRLPAEVRRELEKSIALTANNTGMVLCLALSYGGRAELVDAVKQIAQQIQAGELLPEDVDEHVIEQRLYQPDMPEPDLVIRTAGEMRLSNFLLWQISYAEIYVTDVLWPDFDEGDLDTAIENFRGRVRRYGGLVDRLKQK